MALQTSGVISLNDIHLEAGGTSGTQVSINDADIRDMLDRPSGYQSSFSSFYGAASTVEQVLWTTTLTAASFLVIHGRDPPCWYCAGQRPCECGERVHHFGP